MIARTRRKSVCSTVSRGFMLPLMSVVCSSNIPDRSHLGVSAKTFATRSEPALVHRAESHARHTDNYSRRRSTEERFEKVEAKRTQTGAKCTLGVNAGSY